MLRPPPGHVNHPMWLAAGPVDALYTSHRTATTHVRNILTKLGPDSRTAIAAWAIRGGLA